jgi:hypothetical protein
MPTVAPWATTELLNPWSTSALLTVLVLAATLSSRAVPAVFSCADAAGTTTAMTSPQDVHRQAPLAARHLLARVLPGRARRDRGRRVHAAA